MQESYSICPEKWDFEGEACTSRLLKTDYFETPSCGSSPDPSMSTGYVFEPIKMLVFMFVSAREPQRCKLFVTSNFEVWNTSHGRIRQQFNHARCKSGTGGGRTIIEGCSLATRGLPWRQTAGRENLAKYFDSWWCWHFFYRSLHSKVQVSNNTYLAWCQATWLNRSKQNFVFNCVNCFCGLVSSKIMTHQMKLNWKLDHSLRADRGWLAKMY